MQQIFEVEKEIDQWHMYTSGNLYGETDCNYVQRENSLFKPREFNEKTGEASESENNSSTWAQSPQNRGAGVISCPGPEPAHEVKNMVWLNKTGGTANNVTSHHIHMSYHQRGSHNTYLRSLLNRLEIILKVTWFKKRPEIPGGSGKILIILIRYVAAVTRLIANNV